MSQNVVNYGIDPSGAQLLDELLSGEQQNRLTMDGGNSRPPYAEIGTIWTDKSVTGKATLKRFNGTSDDVMMTIDETTGAIMIPGIADTDLSNLSASGNSKFQVPLVSGTNIKTVNNESLLGSGDITISAGANLDLSNLSETGNDKFVTKDTEQTITKAKTFQDDGKYLIAQNTTVAKNAVPTTGTYDIGGMNFETNEGSLNGYVSSYIDTSGYHCLDICAKSGTASSVVTVAVSPSGTKSAYAPTPASPTANDTQIATTAWVRNHRCITKATTTSSASVDKPAYVVTNYKSGKSWYRVWSDGWIEQGGEVSTATTGSITFLKAFTDANYTACATYKNNGAVGSGATNLSLYPTSSTQMSYNKTSTPISWIACGY